MHQYRFGIPIQLTKLISKNMILILSSVVVYTFVYTTDEGIAKATDRHNKTIIFFVMITDQTQKSNFFNRMNLIL